jgi:hypothetical protein
MAGLPPNGRDDAGAIARLSTQSVTFEAGK